MFDTIAPLGFRWNLFRLAISIVAAIGLLGPPVSFPVACAQDSEEPQTCYLTIATIAYKQVDLRGTDSGFTVACVSGRQSTNTRLVVSGVFAVERPKVKNLRLTARDRTGKVYLPIAQTIAVGTVQERRVITLLCEFPLAEQDIRQLVVERRILVGEANLGVVTARVIIDDDEEEELQIDPAP